MRSDLQDYLGQCWFQANRYTRFHHLELETLLPDTVLQNHGTVFPVYPAKDESLCRFEKVKIFRFNFWLETVSDHVNVYFLTVDGFNFQINPFNLNDEEIQLGFLMKDESLPVNGNS